MAFGSWIKKVGKKLNHLLKILLMGLNTDGIKQNQYWRKYLLSVM